MVRAIIYMLMFMSITFFVCMLSEDDEENKKYYTYGFMVTVLAIVYIYL